MPADHHGPLFRPLRLSALSPASMSRLASNIVSVVPCGSHGLPAFSDASHIGLGTRFCPLMSFPVAVFASWVLRFPFRWSVTMFRRLFSSRLFPARPSADRDVLMRILTTAGMIESSPHGYAASDLSHDVSEYTGQRVSVDMTLDDLDMLEAVGVISEHDGLWSWDVIGVERNQTVVSRLSSHLVG